MVARTVLVAVLGVSLTLLLGCGGGGNDYFSGQKGQAGASAGLDIAGTYQAAPDTFGFNMMTIYQSGNSLSAIDNGGGSWSGTLGNASTEETTGAGGYTVFTWRGDVNLTGKNGIGDNVSLTGVVEIAVSATGNLVVITAQYQNASIGRKGQIVLMQLTATPGGVPGAPGGSDGSNGGENK
jgi:hypothetical protein